MRGRDEIESEQSATGISHRAETKPVALILELLLDIRELLLAEAAERQLANRLNTGNDWDKGE